jgi:hypothetical protein
LNKPHRFAMALSILALCPCACASHADTGSDADATRQGYVDSVNGLKTINGLTSVNGLATVNGLSTTNGLRFVDGLTQIHGLATSGGSASSDGLSVNCEGREEGVDCSGAPDGLLSATMGLMASDAGIATARYLVRCALPASAAVRVRDYTGALVRLPGEIGLTPRWVTDSCDTTCQQWISACLMAFTNGSGAHVAIEMSASNGALGGGHAYPYQEAAFYGNLFVSPPEAYYCAGADFDGVNVGAANVGELDARACAGYTGQSCPYLNTGACNAKLTDPLGLSSGRCRFADAYAKGCKSGPKTWSAPITTHRQELPARHP